MASSSKTQVTQPSYGESSTVKSAVGKDFKANLWAYLFLFVGNMGVEEVLPCGI